MLDGKRYCHIIDPHTGYPVQHTQAVTVLIPPQAVHSTQAGTLSDVASKPIFIEPLAQKSTIAASLGIQHYMVIDQAAQAFVTPELQTKLTWLDADFKRHLHVQATAQH
jgi:thiamine biosynthesis lipoprotein